MSASFRRSLTRWPTPRLRASLAGALLLHGAALAWLWAAWQGSGEGSTARQPLVVRWLDAVHPPERGPDTMERPALPAASPRKAAPARRREVASQPEAAMSSASTATQPGEPAPAAPSVRSRIDPDSVARAAREAARAPSWARQSDELTGRRPAPSAQQKLAADTAAAAKSDCLKGDEGGYAKQGLGLFAIPFLIVDAATGRCRD